MLKLDYSPVPLVLALVLGPLLERGVRRTLMLSEGNLMVFFERPISLVLFILTALVIVLPFVSRRFRSPDLGLVDLPDKKIDEAL